MKSVLNGLLLQAAVREGHGDSLLDYLQLSYAKLLQLEGAYFLVASLQARMAVLLLVTNSDEVMALPQQPGLSASQ